MLVNIGRLRESETIDYAAEELKKYLERMDQAIQCQIVEGKGDITLGILRELSLPDDDVEDDMIDDVIDIRVEFLQGYIAGSNERSVLMGVYEFLKSGGCMWVRPGETGEYIPEVDMHQHCLAFRKKADLSFRGECIEGAVSYENVRDHILWLPKVNMNMFMLEMVVPYNYFSRWYKHSSNTMKEAEDLPYEEYCNFTHKLELLIRKLGLQLHSLGHGYLFEPYGVRYKSPNDHYELPAEAVETVAMVNGKREYFDHSPNYTQICMSNDRARKGLVDFLVMYLEQKPQVDFLHVWLSDAANNHCECENCQKMIPSDFYVQMLNELDAELTKRNMKTRVVFIMYTDTFWAPENNKLNNPGRFIMTTAAFRDYAKPYCFERADVQLQPYKRNQLTYSADFEHTLARMDTWNDVFNGQRFLFEYHLYTDHFYDPGYMEIARNMWADIQALRKDDFDGMMNDQTQRCFFPTGLPVSVMVPLE